LENVGCAESKLERFSLRNIGGQATAFPMEDFR